MFRGPGGLPNMKTLHISAYLFKEAGSINNLVACCPGSEFLNLCYKGIPPLDFKIKGLTALSQLTGLTKLFLYGTRVTDQALGSVADCSSLQVLWVNRPVDDAQPEVITYAGLRQLTRLTNLTKLYWDKCDESELQLTATSDPPDVHLQLQIVCEQPDSSIIDPDTDEDQSDNHWPATEPHATTPHIPPEGDQNMNAWVDDLHGVHDMAAIDDDDIAVQEVLLQELLLDVGYNSGNDRDHNSDHDSDGGIEVDSWSRGDI